MKRRVPWRFLTTAGCALVIATGFSPLAQALSLFEGEPVTAVAVADRGELALEAGDLHYRPWASEQLSGQAGVVLHVAGRLSAKDLNARLIEALDATDLPEARYRTTTIVNTDDAVFGSAMFVRRSVESSKRDAPNAHFVVDDQGAVRRAWGLDAGSSAVVVHDAAGQVRFAKDGALTLGEVQQVMALLESLTHQSPIQAQPPSR